MYLKTREKVYFLVLEYLQLLHFSFYSGENWKFMIENVSFILLSNCKVFKWNGSVAKHLELKFLSLPQKLISEFESRWNLRYLCSLSEIKPQKSETFRKVLVSSVNMIHATTCVKVISVITGVVDINFFMLFFYFFRSGSCSIAHSIFFFPLTGNFFMELGIAEILRIIRFL